eukprot:TRINITY_DN29412_c2_g1_i1.p1 TRINITY_DN29412_c2_g1~~TRINITY_DN29412_c2_g1_i1.p1  ORF type:complete len:404 (-),score=70.19 TRINITY_DN29412_c2_g1_i1:150-1361(-)
MAAASVSVEAVQVTVLSDGGENFHSSDTSQDEQVPVSPGSANPKVRFSGVPASMLDESKDRRPSKVSVVEDTDSIGLGSPVSRTASSPSCESAVMSTTITDMLADLRSEQSVKTIVGTQRSRYEEVRKLGEGGYGVVMEVKKTVTKDRYASKTVGLEEVHEVNICKRLKHPYIVRLHETIREKECIRLIMDLCLGGDLGAWIHDRRKDQPFRMYPTPPSQIVAQFAWQMLAAICYCHHHRIVHRDIKPENFLLTLTGDSGKLKLTDFNLACVFRKGQHMTEECGTMSYIAPEVLEKFYTHLCDIWSVGMVMHALVVGRAYWPKDIQDAELHRMIMGGQVMLQDKRWAEHPAEVKTFVEQLLVKEELRPTAKQAVHNTWVRLNGKPKGEKEPDASSNPCCCSVQ